MEKIRIFANGYTYEVTEEPKHDGDWVLCLGELDGNMLPENKDMQTEIILRWNSGNNCYSCRKIVASDDPKVDKPNPYR